MAEVKVKVVEEFRDRTVDLVLRKKDEVLTVTEDRAEKLVGLGLVEMYVETEPEAPEESENPEETPEELVTEAPEETEAPKETPKRTRKNNK